jgi:hypothetical protein
MLQPKQASERTTTSEVPPAAGKTPEAAARYKRPKWPKARPGKNKKNTHRGNRAKVKSLPQHRDTPTKKKDEKKEQRDEITRETTRPSFARETVRPSIARETARTSVARREITRPSVAKEEARTTPFPAVSNLSDVHCQQGGQQGPGEAQGQIQDRCAQTTHSTPRTNKPDARSPFSPQKKRLSPEIKIASHCGRENRRIQCRYSPFCSPPMKQQKAVVRPRPEGRSKAKTRK